MKMFDSVDRRGSGRVARGGGATVKNRGFPDAGNDAFVPREYAR